VSHVVKLQNREQTAEQQCILFSHSFAPVQRLLHSNRSDGLATFRLSVEAARVTNQATVRSALNGDAGRSTMFSDAAPRTSNQPAKDIAIPVKNRQGARLLTKGAHSG
jgi:hypothetical protein